MTAAHDAFEPEWVWADDEGTSIYAQGYGRGLTVIFSFSADKQKPPTALANRVCTKYEEVETEDPASTFPTIKDLHAAIWGAIRHIWPRCTSHPDLRDKLDAVVDVDSIDSSLEKTTWTVYSHPCFPQFVRNLADETWSMTPVDPGTSIDFARIIRYEQLGGRGCTTRVRLPTGEYAVFKGVDFRTALQYTDHEGDAILRNLIRVWRRECNTLQQLPPHPNILLPPTMLAAIRWPDRTSPPVYCGGLFPFYPGGSISSRIDDSNKKGLRLPLETKAHWCANMAAAVFHVHRVAKTYHMDIKPGNFVADARENLILCDWEQHDAPATTLAPEADGTWDVVEDGPISQRERSPLRYIKYSGPPRRNVEKDVLGDAPWHTWNVFPSWSKEHPWALELAEVFSLGRSMWMLLQQPNTGFEDIAHPDQLITTWDRKSEDIPVTWKHMVDQCMSRDPNERPDLSELVKFWNKEWSAQKAAHEKE
ncbi:Protein kinase-like domain protein [Niveomyces insectorum RCEF 264]|uniref:Protein kinase-like domain protein n=1 Tax=Niveomyces insectorum RCEF 264 TaxID=1081102 RepID=A0A167NRU2_9HYPO|nr:Protein kinase-like domain protein [Niveomyces insectorum RCEF 264]